MTFTPSSPEFVPHPWLRNPHVMTIAPALMPRRWDAAFQQSGERRLFQVEPGTAVLAHCHWQNERKSQPTIVVLHGLEGSAESAHVMAIAQKAFGAGMNALRLNMRNCGGTMSLTRTLYNGGLSKDLISVIRELHAEGFKEIFIAGFSLGGNVVLKTAGELGGEARALIAGAAAISPAIDLQVAVRAIEQPRNRIYEYWFLRTLKEKIRQKNRLFPDLFDLSLLPSVRSLRKFDDVYTAPDGGYGNADNYYFQASSIRVIDKIEIPTLIVAAEDDPLVPFSMFDQPALHNPNIHLLAARYGGHAGFVHRYREGAAAFDRFWAENRVVTFCQDLVGIRNKAQ